MQKFIVFLEFWFIAHQTNSFRFSHPRQFVMISEQTKKYFDGAEKASNSNPAQSLGAGSSLGLQGLQNLDMSWNTLKNGGWSTQPKEIVYSHECSSSDESHIDFDVGVSGGTLGLFYAIGLLKMNHKVCIIERGVIAGRVQEWNISEKELRVLVKLNIITLDEFNQIKSIKFNPARVGFKLDTSKDAPPNGYELYVEDILNLGIRPDILISILKKKFIELGGTIYEKSALEKVDVYDDKCVISYASNNKIEKFSCRLLIDSMGNGSPISKQTRGAVEPDGICIVVGSCAQGFPAVNNTYSDIIYTNSPIHSTMNKASAAASTSASSSLQYFWEAFPAGSGPSDRTTYLFTYMDAKPERPSVSEIFDDYWELLPRYQGVDVNQLQFLRFLYGVFPTYRASPIQTSFDRILAVGDASGIQSPLSFGGFGSLTRHIERILQSVDEALKNDLLDAEYMNAINAYQPNLGTCWMFQRAMSVPVGSQPAGDLIVNNLANSFSSMNKLGMKTIKPFLQDVLQFFPLLNTLFNAAQSDPLTPVKIVPHVGIPVMFDFVVNFLSLFWYTLLATYVSPVLRSSYLPNLTSPSARFKIQRAMEAWKFGSGLDYDDHDD